MTTKTGTVRQQCGSGEAWADNRCIHQVIEIIAKHRPHGKKLTADDDVLTRTKNEIVLRTRIPLHEITTDLTTALRAYGEVYAQDGQWFLRIRKRYFPPLGLIGMVLITIGAFLGHVAIHFSAYRNIEYTKAP